MLEHLLGWRVVQQALEETPWGGKMTGGILLEERERVIEGILLEGREGVTGGILLEEREGVTGGILLEEREMSLILEHFVGG